VTTSKTSGWLRILKLLGWAFGPFFVFQRWNMIRQAPAKVIALLQPVIEGLGYEFVGSEYLAQGKHSVLRVYIDKPEVGVNVDDCATVSRQVSGVLDVEDPISGKYVLEVSSPGMDRPLFTLEHFERFSGQEVNLLLSAPVNGRRKLKGVLSGCEEGVIKIEFEGEVLDVAFENIEKARLVPVFD
jgi:ribosome maturation factor RimP